MAIAAGNWQTGSERGLYLLRTPVAPHVAAELEGQRIDIDKVVAMALQSTTDCILVEGAGGLRVPINTDSDMARFAKACGFPVIVVARASLGTINHSVLTVEAAQRDGLSVVAVVLSRLPNVELETAERNRSEIERICHVPTYVFDGSKPSALVAFLATTTRPNPA